MSNWSATTTPGAAISAGRWATVAPWQRGVVIKDGVITTTLEPGRHRRRRRSVVNLIDLRPSILTIPTQEVLTADGVQVRLSVIAQVAVTDAALWITASAAPLEVIYSALQVALRDRVAALELGAISSSRTTLLDGVEEELAPTFASIGAVVTGIALKDITLPAEVRVAVAQAALNKQRGLAELERARTEAAAMRSLANTAKLMAEHPELLQLRTLQAAAEGAQIIIHRDAVVRED